MKEKIKPKEQRKHLIKAYLDDKEYEKFKIFASVLTAISCVIFWQVRDL